MEEFKDWDQHSMNSLRKLVIASGTPFYNQFASILNGT